MPRCSSCGKNYDNSSVMELVRNKENRWVSICKPCLDQGVDVNLVQPANIAIDEAVLASADRPFIDATLLGDPIANAKKLLESLRQLRQSKERVGRARSHERRQVELTVHFTLARDDTRHDGVVKDFSQSGLRVVTNHPLVKGQTVQFDWNIPLPPSMAKELQNTAEVKRVTKNDDGQYDVGFKFMVRQQVDKGANRRRHRRYKCDMLAYYQRRGSQLVSCCKVSDISQGGCQMRLEEELPQGETFSVRLVGGGGVKGDLVGTMRACRTVRKEPVFETGCAFERMRMEAQPASPLPAS